MSSVAVLVNYCNALQLAKGKSVISPDALNIHFKGPINKYLALNRCCLKVC